MRGFEADGLREFRDGNELARAWDLRNGDEMRRLLDRAVSASVNGIVITDPTLPDDPIIYTNRAFERMTGYTREESVGHNCRFLQKDDGDQEEIERLRDALRKGRESRVVIRNYRKSGEMFWNELYVSPVHDEKGNLTNFIGVQHDITERKRAQDALSEQEAQWRTLIENNPSFVALINLDGTATYYNAGWLEYLGVESEELLRREWPQKIHPEDRDDLRRTLKAAYEAGENFSIPSMRIQRGDGNYHWFSALVSPVVDESGEITSWITVSTDIEEIRKTEQVLRESEERLRLALRATSLGTWDYNPIAGDLRWDDRTKAMFGLPPEFENVTYDTFHQGLHASERDRVEGAIKQAFDPEGDGIFEEVFQVTGADGVVRWLYSTGQAFFSRVSGVKQTHRFIGTILDITERKRAEEERDLLLAREQLARAEAVSARRRLDFLVEADTVLLSSTGYKQRLRDTAKLAARNLCDWCLVDVVDETGNLTQVSSHHEDPLKQELLDELERHRNLGEGATGVATSVYESGKPLLMPDTSALVAGNAFIDEERRKLLEKLGMGSLMSVPLLARGRTLGVMTLVSSDPIRTYGREDLSLAENLAYRCALAADNALLYRERSRIARTLQQSLLPKIPEVENVEVGVVYLSVGEESLIGGDFYDLIQTDSGKLLAVVGDVCGKGPAAAAVTALARYTIQAVVMEKDSPANALNSLNRAMLRQVEDVKFCTVACGRLEEAEGTNGEFDFIVARGGHPALILVRASGEVEKINPKGRVIGVFDAPGLEEEWVRLKPGDSVVLYTDGVIEAKNAEGELFGEEHLLETLAGLKGLSARQIADGLCDMAHEFSDGSLKDDIAILVIRIPPEPPLNGTSPA
ncbi:PAS domain S-box protein [Rubrobacter indicoceani]|uniref:PAS domain S-box protein n=1 Tax=Rubrobacter indicoceani TaxID=2051957 RepID=UPI000E5AC529|nr:PAS domain S-box protein [Rubrobacter indicoceani]